MSIMQSDFNSLTTETKKTIQILQPIKLFRDKTFVIKLLKCLLCALVMGGVGFAATRVSSVLGVSSRIMIIPVIVVCVAVYFGMMLVTKTVTKSELKTLIKRK